MINPLNSDFYTGLDSNNTNNPYTYINSNSFIYGIWVFEKTTNKTTKEANLCLKTINRAAFLVELNQLGFYKRICNNEQEIFIRENGNIIAEVTLEIIQDVFYNSVILCQETNIKVSYNGLTQVFNKEEFNKVYFNVFHLLFNHSFLLHLKTHDKEILRDGNDFSYFFFKNCIVKTTSEKIQIIEYCNIIEECIWEDQIINFNFSEVAEVQCNYSQFIYNVADSDINRINSFRSAIGYLLHNYNRSTGGQCVILYDQAPAPKGQPEGGTGKGIYVKGLKIFRVTVKIDGKKIRTEDKFKFQSIQPTTQIIWLDDVHSKFSFEDLHSNLSDGWTIEKKHQPEIFIPAVESPKVVIASNTVLESGGTTNIRRQFILEFSNYYSKHIIKGNEEPVKEEHGCVFFDIDYWDQNEWNRFFTYMLNSSVYYFKNGLIDYEKKGLLKNQLLQNTSEDFVEWIEANNLIIGTEYEIKLLFEEFKLNFSEDPDIKQNTFSKFIKRYATYSNLKYESRPSSGKKYIKLVKKCI
jgi:hypothetical protein